MAPNIVQHPRSEASYKPFEDVTLDCVADTDSYALYEWRKDGRHVNLNGTNVVMSSGSGSITIKAPSDENDGVYQCFVRNQFGTAMSSKSTVKKADLQPFPTVFEPVAMSPIIGQVLSLNCLPPKSYPKGFVYWGTSRPHSNKLQTIENNERILLDYEGNLHFANVVPNDSLGGASYVCIVFNALLGAYVQGNDHVLTPVEVKDIPKYYPPQLLWSSPAVDVALKGQTKRIKCIFSGLPTPKVTWRRLDRPIQMVGSRAVVTPGGHGTELEITNVETEDGGRYECTATNSRNGTGASRIITLVVHSVPFWSEGRSPSTIQTEEESSVEINCLAHGTPTPNISFLFNGVPFEEMPPDSRRSISRYKIVYSNVTTSDTQVVQCIASNEHGMILANIILSVIAAPPSFIETPSNAKVVEGQSVVFRCLADGAPKPVVTWRKGKSREPVSGDRFAVRSSGNLEIKNASVSDSNTFHCHAVNKFGTDDVTVNLTVRQPTRILPSFEELMVNASLDVSLPCKVEADPTERPNLVVEWRKGDDVIDYAVEGRRLKIHPTEFSLHIDQSQVSDSANYSCHVRSSLDAAVSLPIRLTVSGRPDPPYDVTVSTCAAKYAIVSWKVGRDNNYPLLEFVVFYNDSIDGTDRSVEGARVEAEGSSDFVRGQEVQAVVYGIRPWSVYSFHVVARNLIGVSDRSTSPHLCVTSQMVPERNPGGVCSKRRGPTQLVIVWEEILRPEWNGEGFHYVVSYRPLHSTRAAERLTIANPQQTELEIYDLNTFAPYEIYVQSANNIGLASIRESEKRIGYSGEGVPLVSPANFELVSLNSTQGEFSWDAVDTNAKKVRGFFRGYRLRFWRSSDLDDVREEDVIFVKDVDLCPLLNDHKHRSVRSFDKVTGTTTRLWPYSTVTAGIVVLNYAHSGPLSNTVEFHTPEGVPGRVSSAMVVEQGSSHLRIKWDTPEEPNGVVVGYEISYQVAPPAVSRLQSLYVNSTENLSKKLLNLEFSTMYRVSIAATTAAGTGEPTSVFGGTRPFGVPDRPVIVNVETGSDFANVTWSSSIHKVPVNPGHSFYLQYRYTPEGSGQWSKVNIDPEATENWINVTDLDPGSYEFQMVAVNGFDDLRKEIRSSIVNANVEPEVSEHPKEAPVLYERASSYWFIVLICIVIFLVLVLLIVCLVRYTRGDVYPVSKKERLCGNDPYATEDVPFGEFKRQNSRSSRNGGSEVSIESDDKAPESDSDDSLEEYNGTDPTKFNEDGSFIGLYVGKSKRESSDPTNNPTSPLDTIV